jgi:predicted dehydrogenase
MGREASSVGWRAFAGLLLSVAATIVAVAGSVVITGCAGSERDVADDERFIVLDPGHFHASLLFRTPIEGVSDTIRVYAPAGPELDGFVAAVEGYNSRADDPTHWVIDSYVGDDYLEQMTADPRGGPVILAGNNRMKTRYILASVSSGHSVLSDKPMAIDGRGFDMLAEAYRVAAEKGLVIYDMMTERYDTLNIAVRRLMADTGVFGTLTPGTPAEPSIAMRSVHHFFKSVGGAPLRRPAWYYDVAQQGEGVADVTTHLIDLAMWWAFPGGAVGYPTDVTVTAARHWPTPVTREEYALSTGWPGPELPPYMERYLSGDTLGIMANGSMTYAIKGVNVGMEVVWNYSAPDGGGDTFSATITGTRARLEIVQDASTGYVKQLYIIPNGGERRLVDIPAAVRTGHEAHFGLVAATFLDYLRGTEMPAAERENTLSKYHITTRAVTLAGGEQTE